MYFVSSMPTRRVYPRDLIRMPMRLHSMSRSDDSSVTKPGFAHLFPDCPQGGSAVFITITSLSQQDRPPMIAVLVFPLICARIVWLSLGPGTSSFPGNRTRRTVA